MDTIMKKILISSLVLAAAVSASAQNMYDAMSFSQNNYSGSTRSIALGNAVTALGGDLGMIGINPAGSAVAGYSQITITPGLQLSSVSSAYSNAGESAYGLASTTSRMSMNMPNIGISLAYDMRGSSSGLRRFTFALVSNQTNAYDYAANAYGTNSMTSKAGEAAFAAQGISENVLSKFSSFNSSDVSWDILAAYQGGAFSTYGVDGRYAAANQKIGRDASHVYVPGALSQVSDISKKGVKRDVVLNFGFDYSDKLYVGVNFGMPSLSYTYYDNFSESAVNPNDFPVSFNDRGGTVSTEFRSADFNYHYTAEISGIYMKVGAIYLPNDHLRLGAAIQTPSMFEISETWQNSCSTVYSNSKFNAKGSSPVGEYSYSLVTPYEINLGAAYTFTRGLLSVDYEMMDYSVMRFSEGGLGYQDDTYFRAQNQANKYFAGVSHSLRIGGEYKLTPEISFRAGYSFITGAEKHWTNTLGEDVDASGFYDNYNA